MHRLRPASTLHLHLSKVSTVALLSKYTKVSRIHRPGIGICLGTDAVEDEEDAMDGMDYC